MDDLEKLAESPDGLLKAGYVAADFARLEPLLKSGDAAQVNRAVTELQSWANGADGLRKAFASHWLEQAKSALGGMSAATAIKTYGRKVEAGAAVQGGDAGMKARFAKAKHHPVPSPSNHPGARIEQGGPAARLDAGHKPAGKIQHGMVPHPRLSPPAPAAAVADKAHAQGASLAAKSAKHGFKLGLAAAAAVGGGAALAHHHSKHHQVAKGAENEGLEKAFEAGIPGMRAPFAPAINTSTVASRSGYGLFGFNSSGDDKKKKKVCPACGQTMAKGAENDGLEKGAQVPMQRPVADPVTPMQAQAGKTPASAAPAATLPSKTAQAHAPLADGGPARSDLDGLQSKDASAKARWLKLKARKVAKGAENDGLEKHGGLFGFLSQPGIKRFSFGSRHNANRQQIHWDPEP